MPRLLFTTPAQQKQPHLLNLQKLSQSGRPPAEPTAEDKLQEERLVSATETSTANEAARPETPSLFSRLRRFLTGVKSRTSEPSVIQEKKAHGG